MSELTKILITGLLTIVASSGFWIYLQHYLEKRNARTAMILGLGHDRIINYCLMLMDKGSVSEDEYENLSTYLYAPYKKLGGNGSADRMFQEINKLPIRRIRNDTQ